jgi:hypothetical protein
MHPNGRNVAVTSYLGFANLILHPVIVNDIEVVRIARYSSKVAVRHRFQRALGIMAMWSSDSLHSEAETAEHTLGR